MTYEDRRVVTEDEVPTTERVVREPAAERVVREPATVVEERVPRRQQVVVQDDPVGNAYAASQLISTIVWAVVVLVLLVVALWALHVYAGLF